MTKFSDDMATVETRYRTRLEIVTKNYDKAIWAAKANLENARLEATGRYNDAVSAATEELNRATSYSTILRMRDIARLEEQLMVSLFEEYLPSAEDTPTEDLSNL